MEKKGDHSKRAHRATILMTPAAKERGGLDHRRLIGTGNKGQKSRMRVRERTVKKAKQTFYEQKAEKTIIGQSYSHGRNNLRGNGVETGTKRHRGSWQREWKKGFQTQGSSEKGKDL